MTGSGGGAGRVIAGTARGVRLSAPGSVTRPLSDRVKQTLFAVLDPSLRGATVLDLFAGSGAAGIEALSRGAIRAIFVERDRRAVATIETNLERAHLAGPEALVIRRDAIGWLGSSDAMAHGPVGVAIVDPPYDQPDLMVMALDHLGRSPTPMGRGSIVVAKHFWRDQPPDTIGLLASDRARRFGDTALTFYRVVDPAEAPA
ncbi:MAG: RsmD family RNA methyltransferase [Chloroflexi bacterium]|nr:RsmD family RNA methyltransferase [Chloroflexota bacterium]